MARLFTVAGALLLTLGWAVVSVSADDKHKGQKDKAFDDAEFVKHAASGGMLEVALGKLAKEKATGGDVRKFADRMIADHTKANKELAAVAKAAGYSIPDKLTPKHQEHLDKFKKEPSKSFDAEYVKHMVKDHEEAVEEFDRATREAKHPELKKFAEKTLPTLREHYAQIKQIRDAMPKR